jgi:hypothetical protein
MGHTHPYVTNLFVDNNRTKSRLAPRSDPVYDVYTIVAAPALERLPTYSILL